MTTDEGYKILVESLLQTESSKGAYFLKKSKELEIDPNSFFTDLKSLYDTMVKFVNSKDRTVWGVDEEGNREATYNTINIFHLTNGSHTGFFDKENIWQFLPGLEQFGKIIMNELKEKQTAKTSELIEILKTNIENVIQSRAVSIPQLTTDLKADQIKNLFESLVTDKFIPANTDPDSFKWIFGYPEQSRPDQWKPIEWQKNKQLLRELLEEIKQDNVKIADIERIVPILFYKNGTPLKLANNKITETQDHRKLKKIIATCLTT